jgi:hypothetical protein
MTSDEILTKMIERYPRLLPWANCEVGKQEGPQVARELSVLIGSWDRIESYIPVNCGHAACRRSWVEGGGYDCIAGEGQAPKEDREEK